MSEGGRARQSPPAWEEEGPGRGLAMEDGADATLFPSQTFPNRRLPGERSYGVNQPHWALRMAWSQHHSCSQAPRGAGEGAALGDSASMRIPLERP